MKFLSCILVILLLTGCVATRTESPNKKYGSKELRKDYALFQSVLETQHPGLYWYTSKDSMDYFFRKGQSMLKDSMTEGQFRNVLSYVVAQLKCGHTTVRPSKALASRGAGRYFPLVIKAWEDTAVVTMNLNRRDSSVYRGVLLTAIEKRPLFTIIDSMFQYLSADGYNLTHKYQTISNRGPFGNLYTALYGTKPRYNIQYIDSLGRSKTADVSIYNFVADSTPRQRRIPMPHPPRRERRKLNLLSNRRLSFDTSLNMALMDLNTFTRGYRLRKFFRQTFKTLSKQGTQNLVIDLRSNGGGSVTNSNLLTKYISSQPFKIADSLYALSRKNKYKKYQNDRISNWLFLQFMTHKKRDGYYHFRYFERKYFKPRKRNHYNGQVYILTGGNTFSASTLFAQAVREQDNVTIVGEETGGGAYGNNAWLIPDVTLPNTKVRFRLPLFRLVINKDFPKTGHGVQPEVEALPTVQDIRKNIDYKMEKTRALIKEKG